MPRRTDIESILIVGAGPIVIGQACEFDYSGTQACKALREEGYRVILVNSNPATIMTDPELADRTYIEPLIPEAVERIIEKERPDALLPTVGGQTALNMALSLKQLGVLDQGGIQLIGAQIESIELAENRELFAEAMTGIGLEVPRGGFIRNMAEARELVQTLRMPVIFRPSFTLGGQGGGTAYNIEEFETRIFAALEASPIDEVLVEENLRHWKEYELEVVRDHKDNCVVVCSIENLDPMGVHTGDSVTVAPAMTLTDREYQAMRDDAFACMRRIGVDTGGSNVQFAVDPDNGRLLVIEMNPRVSRSSALASKATGFPIAKVAAKLAVGYTLDELMNDITGVTPASFEPTIDYVVTKIPRFTFEKFPGTKPELTTSMKSVGEAMAIGRTFAESLQKGLRSMETGLTGLNEVEIEGARTDGGINTEAVLAALSKPRPERILVIAQAFRLGVAPRDIQAACKYDPWFLDQIRSLVNAEEEIRGQGLAGEALNLLRWKKLGFSDQRLAELTGWTEAEVASRRHRLGVRPVYKRVDTCAAEFPSRTPYMYSAYEGDGVNPAECEADPSDRPKVVILGGGPNRIGQGIEFDYCCVHAAYALKEAGIEAIMVNCNPETVSTDYDTSDRLYFEPLTAEDVIELIRVERSRGDFKGVIVQFGGQTPLKLAAALEAAGIPILGTSPDAIDLAEDRERFQVLLRELGLGQPANGLARSVEEAEKVGKDIGYPLVIRPSYVLGGRAMEIVHDRGALLRYMKTAVQVSGDSPVLLDSFLDDAIEVDVDAIGDGSDVFVAGIMEHIEEAGIHSGDSACSLPPHSLPADVIEELERQTAALARALNVVGLMNVQFAVKDGDIYVIEVNPRASRTVPFVAKATGVPIAKLAARVMTGERLASFSLMTAPGMNHVAVKEAVFPFARFPGVDIILGPEMKSTGEVMGIAADFSGAFAKAQLGAGTRLPDGGTVFISVKERDKQLASELAERLQGMGFALAATSGTQKYLEAAGLRVRRVNKVLEGRPHCVDAIISGEVQLVINTTEGAQAIADSYSIRRSVLMGNVPHYTTMTGAAAAVGAIESLRAGRLDVAPLQSYLKTSF